MHLGGFYRNLGHQLETDLRTGIESDPAVVSVGSIRFHCLTDVAT